MTKQNEKFQEILRLMQENPDLPVIAMVGSEVVADDSFPRWLGIWGNASIQEYWLGEEKIHFRDDEDSWEVEDTINDPFCVWPMDNPTDEEALEMYRALPWTKAIVVDIDPFDPKEA